MRKRVGVGMFASFIVLITAHFHHDVMHHKNDTVCWSEINSAGYREVICGDPRLRPQDAGPTFAPKELSRVLSPGETTHTP